MKICKASKSSWNSVWTFTLQAAKNNFRKFLVSCFLTLVPALTRIKVTVFGHNNSEDLALMIASLPSLI